MTSIRIFALSALCAAGALASEKTQNVEVTIPARATVAEQIALARQYSSQAVRAANDEERRKQRLTAISAWEMVARRTASDRASLMLARLAQADLWLDLRAAGNAVTTLEQVLPVATAARNEAAVYRRLGNAYELLGRDAEAEAAFANAEADPLLQKEPRLALMTLTDAARFYERTKRPADAAKRYARLSRMPQVGAGSRAQAAIKAGQMNVRANDKASARAAVGETEALIADARRGGESPELLTMLERELARLREATY